MLSCLPGSIETLIMGPTTFSSYSFISIKGALDKYNIYRFYI